MKFVGLLMRIRKKEPMTILIGKVRLPLMSTSEMSFTCSRLELFSSLMKRGDVVYRLEVDGFAFSWYSIRLFVVYGTFFRCSTERAVIARQSDKRNLVCVLASSTKYCTFLELSVQVEDLWTLYARYSLVQ